MAKETKGKKPTLHPDIAYIEQDEVGKVICKGLAEVSKVRPSNPVDYLAKWLLAYQSQTTAKLEVRLTVNSVDERTRKEKRRSKQTL